LTLPDPSPRDRSPPGTPAAPSLADPAPPCAKPTLANPAFAAPTHTDPVIADPAFANSTLANPVFAEPWQARAFALALKLSERGHFTPTEWTTALARELHTVATRGEVDDGSRYYNHWLTALETLVVEKGLTNSAALTDRKKAWRDAYHRTPHGKPVELP
jgi:nitrile hydratase accessory protein